MDVQSLCHQKWYKIRRLIAWFCLITGIAGMGLDGIKGQKFDNGFEIKPGLGIALDVSYPDMQIWQVICESLLFFAWIYFYKITSFLLKAWIKLAQHLDGFVQLGIGRF